MSSVVNSSATLPSTKYNEYEVEGGLKIQDATGGMAKAVFSKIDKSTGLKVYKILINNRELFPPADTSPLQFAGSDLLKFKEKNGYIQIKEVDKGQVLRLYVDVQKIQDIKEGVPLLFYRKPPCLLTEEQLALRLNSFKDKYLATAKEIQILAYNRHAVVVVGWTHMVESAFYRSKPMPFFAFSNTYSENWYFCTGRDYGTYTVQKEEDGTSMIMAAETRNSGTLEIHRYPDAVTNEEKIAINGEEAQKLFPDWKTVANRESENR